MSEDVTFKYSGGGTYTKIFTRSGKRFAIPMLNLSSLLRNPPWKYLKSTTRWCLSSDRSTQLLSKWWRLTLNAISTINNIYIERFRCSL